MRRHAPRISSFAAGLIAIALIGLGVYFAFAGGVSVKDEYTIHAAFRTTNNLGLRSPVRLAGVDIGEVTAVRHAGEGQEGALVEMRIEDAGLPLHRDAEFTIRPRLFLEGNFFVDVKPGTPQSPELEDGAVVPVNQTATPVQLGQVLAALQSDTRQDLQVMLAELSRALDGEGARGLNRSLEHAAPAYRDLARVAEAAQGERGGDLAGFVRGAERVATGLARDGEALRSLITDAHASARALAAEDENLGAAVAELPATLRAANTGLGKLNDAFPAVRSLVRDLRPGVRAAGPAVRDLRPLAAELRGLAGPRELRGAARSLRPSVPALNAVLRDGLPALRELRLAAGCATDVILPWGHDKIEDDVFPAAGPVYTEIPKSFPGLAGESRSGDANGQWVRTLAQGGNYVYPEGPDRFLVTTRPIMGSNPPKPDRLPELRPEVPCETQERPDLRSEPAPPPAGFRVNTASPDAVALRSKAVERLIPWARKVLRREGLDDLLSVSDEVLEPGQIPKLRKAGG